MLQFATCIALAGALELGAYAQGIVLAPQPETTIRTLSPTVRRSGSANGSALAVEVEGVCKVSTNGAKFHNLKPGAELPEHAVVRTASGTVDLFVRRMGATIRLKPNTEVAIDRAARTVKDDQHELTTTVEVHKGSILSVVHANVAGSNFVIKNAAGNTLKDAAVGSRYVVSADAFKEAGSEKLASEMKGETNRKLAAIIREQVELDEVQGLAETSDSSNPGLEQ